MNTCEKCGNDFEDSVLTETQDGAFVCPDCLNEHYVQCDDCGEWIPRDEARTDDNGTVLCEDCYDGNYFTCEDCGAITHNDDGYQVNPNYRDERYVCGRCADRFYTRCRDCDELLSDSHIWRDDICGSCADSYRICNNCGEVIHEDDAYYDDSDDAFYCDSCRNSRRSRSLIHDYSYKPDPVFYRRKDEDDSAYTLGVELEIDQGDDVRGCAEALTEVTDAIYLKHDGSLNDGIEIVTHPGTLAYHQYELRWKALCKAGLDHGFRSHDAGTCGLHVHVGRKQLGADRAEREATIAKVIFLVDRHWDRLVTFSRRSPRQLERWANRPRMDIQPSDTAETLTAKALETRYAGRYQAINLENRATIEFRFFRGTLRRDTLIASLQLVHNICEYAQTHTLEDVMNTSTWEDITSVKRHAELDAYLANMLPGR